MVTTYQIGRCDNPEAHTLRLLQTHCFHSLAVPRQVFPVLQLPFLRDKRSPYHLVIQQVSTRCNVSELISGGVTFESQSRHRSASHRSLILFLRPSKHMPVQVTITQQFPTNSLFIIPPFYATTLAASDKRFIKHTLSAPVLHTLKLCSSPHRRH